MRSFLLQYNGIKYTKIYSIIVVLKGGDVPPKLI